MLAAYVYVNHLSAIRDVPLRGPLGSLPEVIDGWTMLGQMDPAKLAAVLKSDDVFVRKYRRDDGLAAEVYVSYFNHVGPAKAPHAPQLCWVGSGWMFKNLGDERIPLGSEKTPFASIRTMVAEKGSDRVFLLYCYKINGAYASDLGQFRIMAAFDTIFRRRNCAMTLQVTSPVRDEDINAQVDELQRFVAKILSYLEDHCLPC